MRRAAPKGRVSPQARRSASEPRSSPTPRRGGLLARPTRGHARKQTLKRGAGYCCKRLNGANRFSRIFRFMEAVEKVRWDTPQVQVHIEVMQGVIQRMAANSASAKTWCLTIVSAILVVAVEKGRPGYAWIAFIPALMLGLIDAYYLALERAFRASYNRFLERLHEGRATSAELFRVEREGRLWLHTLRALGSFSVWGVYGPLLIAVGIISFWLSG